VFIDGQTDFYGEALTREYERVIQAEPGWEEILTKYSVGWLLIPPGERLERELNAVGGWREVYRDESAVIFSRAGAAP
jgi:hypothetical protein